MPCFGKTTDHQMRITVLIILVSLLRGILPAQQTYFSNNFDCFGAPNFTGSVIQTADSGFVCISSNFLQPFLGYTFIKTDKSGDTVFTKKYIYPDRAFALGVNTHSFILSNDGTYLACGSAVDTNNNNDAYLVKLDIFGDTIWTKRFGGVGDDFLNSLYQDQSGRYWICGATTSQGSGLGDFWLVHLDATANYVWDTVYGTALNETAVSGELTPDGGFIMGGARGNVPYLVKVDSTGSLQWQFTYSNYAGYGYVSLMPDSGYIVACGKVFSANEEEGCLLKIDTAGGEEWANFVGFTFFKEGLTAKPIVDSNSIVVVGVSKPGSGYYGAYLAKTNSVGGILWQRRYVVNTNSNHYTYGVSRTSDSGYIIGGSCVVGTQDAWLVKVDSMGCEVAGCDGVGFLELENERRLSVYPNPASNDATVRLTSIGGKETYIEVSNSLGQVVDNISLNGLTTVQLITESYSAGLFHLRLLENGECLASEKLLIIK